MVQVSELDRLQWDGYDFQWDEDEVRRPNHPFECNKDHPPMMANTHCIEKGEVPNLALFTEDDVIIFKVTKPIRGGDVLLVNYGDKYNDDLSELRLAKITTLSSHCSAQAKMKSYYFQTMIVWCTN